MKKIFMFVLFCLPILRGANFLHAQDSLRLTMTSTVSDATCGNKYTVTATTLGTVTQPIAFMLDSTWSSSTGVFDKVSWGYHVISARDAAGRKGFFYFNLQGNNAPFIVYPNFTSNCNGTGSLSLSARTANPSNSLPFQFKLDNGAFQSDSVFKNVALGFHSYTVKNQAGCEYTAVFKASQTDTYNPYYSSYYDAICGKNGNFRIYASNGYTYTLDNLAANGDSINVWRNVAPGNHILKVSDGTCVLETKTIALNAAGLQAYFTPLVDSCNNAESGYYRIDVNGGQAPFTYSLDNDSTKSSSNIVRLQNYKTYRVVVKDATNCAYNGYYTPYYYEDLYVETRFTANTCTDSSGTLQLLRFYKSGQQFRPLSISFDGRPFSTDTVIKNVKPNSGGYAVKVKTKSGCEGSTRVYFYPNSKLTDASTYFSITNCTANTGT
jgi:large repetitive protein